MILMSVKRMEQSLDDVKRDSMKFVKGNESAGVRMRVSLQRIKTDAQELRQEILKVIKERKANKS